MSVQKGFSVAIYRDGKYLDSVSYNSQDLMCKELRSMGAVFRNGTFKNLDNKSITVYGCNGFQYEVEELPFIQEEKMYIDLKGRHYIPLADYCVKYETTKQRVLTQIKKSMLESINVGAKKLIYVRVN